MSGACPVMASGSGYCLSGLQVRPKLVLVESESEAAPGHSARKQINESF